MTADAVVNEAVALWPLRPCTPWCNSSDQHINEHPEKRNRYSHPYEVVRLSRRAPVRMVDRQWTVDQIEVLLQRPAAEDDSVLVLADETKNASIELTRTEAEQLMAAMGRLLALDQP